MKKVFPILFLSAFSFACGNSSDNATNTNNEDEHTDMQAAASPSSNTNARHDDVCGMGEGEIPWEDYSVYNNDTLWFCSPVCKAKFDKEPAKYVKN